MFIFINPLNNDNLWDFKIIILTINQSFGLMKNHSSLVRILLRVLLPNYKHYKKILLFELWWCCLHDRLVSWIFYKLGRKLDGWNNQGMLQWSYRFLEGAWEVGSVIGWVISLGEVKKKIKVSILEKSREGSEKACKLGQ